MPVTGPSAYTAQDAIHALDECNCNITAAARKLTQDFGRPITRAHLKQFIDKTPVLMTFIDDYRQSMVDEAEDVIFDSVKHLREREDAKFILRTLGRDRGYVPKIDAKVEHVGDLGETIREARQRSRGASAPLLGEGEVDLATPDSGQAEV